MGPLSSFLPQVLEFGAAGGREEDEQPGVCSAAPLLLRSAPGAGSMPFWGGLGLDERAERAGWGKPGSSSARPALLPPRVLSGSEVGSPRTASSCLGDGGSG